MADRERTRTPGIYRRGGRYVFAYRTADGRQHWESCRTLDEARRAKQARTTDIARGEFEERSRVTLHEYAREWVERYQGRGRRGFRENTREEYRRQLDTYVLEHFSERVRLTEVSPAMVARFVSWLCKQERPAPTEEDPKKRVPLSDATVRNVMAPLRACLASAVREGLIRSNPAREVDLPHRPTAESAELEEVHAMSQDQLATMLGSVPEAWHTFFWFLGSTGLRISEVIALQWRDLELTGAAPRVKVRRALVKGRLGPPKSRYGRREVPLDQDLVKALRAHHEQSEWPGEDDLVFPATNGSPLMPANVFRRVLQPAREAAGLPWVGFHTFRHTCASLLFAQGRNAVQVQRWLGHHSPAFTLSRYTHLLDGDIGKPLALAPRQATANPPNPSAE